MFEKLTQWASQKLSSQTTDVRVQTLPPPPILNDFGELDDVRIVVMDLETSGLNLQKDLVLAIGAVAVNQGRIDLADQFEVVLRQAELKQDDTLLIHGLGPEALAKGAPPDEGLLDFLHWAESAPFIAFHAPFDKRMLERSLKTHLGLTHKYVWLDLADILPALFPAAETGPGRLDDWVAHFHLDVSSRHNAAADALATAELLLIALREARTQSIKTLPQLAEKARNYRQLANSRRCF